MENTAIESNEIVSSPNAPTYEAPQVESVLTPEEMEREILYAGNGGTIRN